MTFTISNWISQGFVQADKSQAVIQIARNSFLKGKKILFKISEKTEKGSHFDSWIPKLSD